MYRTQRTKNVPFIFFLVNAFNSAFALYYGLLVDNSTFILINAVGIVFWGLYIIIYIGVSTSKIEIVQEGSSAGSDLFLLFGGTLCCLAWLLYGYLLNDVFVYGPNILGLGVNGIKLAIIAAYRGSKGKLE